MLHYWGDSMKNINFFFIVTTIISFCSFPAYCLPREIELDIKADFPEDDPLEPDIFFNGNEYDYEPVEPGQYELLLKHPGF